MFADDKVLVRLNLPDGGKYRYFNNHFAKFVTVQRRKTRVAEGRIQRITGDISAKRLKGVDIADAAAQSAVGGMQRDKAGALAFKLVTNLPEQRQGFILQLGLDCLPDEKQDFLLLPDGKMFFAAHDFSFLSS